MGFRLRANHLTVSRMVLLPLPSALLLRGRLEQLIALGAFALLALTDWWDGKLARRQGPTVLGALLDPIADKMFLAFTFLPMTLLEGVHGTGHRLMPLWVVAIIFFRELGVTNLRTLSASYGIEFETAILAKFKTAFQMGGGGIFLWAAIWQDHWSFVLGSFAVLFASILLFAAVRALRGRPVGLKVWTQVGGYAANLLVAWLAPRQWYFWSVIAIILGLTLASGGHYVRRTITGMRERGWPASFGGLSVAVLETLAPVAVLTLLAFEQVSIWAVIAMLTAELAAGGLCSLLAKEKVRRRLWLAAIRSFVLLGLAALGWVGPKLADAPQWPTWASFLAAAVSLFYGIGLFLAHRRIYLR